MNNSTEGSTQPEAWVTPVKCATSILIFLLTVSSNSFVLWAVLCRNGCPRKTQLLSRVQLFMVNLSVADILVALLHNLPQLAWDLTGNFRGGLVLCKVVKYAQVFVLYLSTYIVTGMAIDRFVSMQAIKAQWQSGMRQQLASGKTSTTRNTFNNHKSRASYRRSAKCLIASAWLVSALLTLPQLFIFSLTVADGKPNCASDFSFHRHGEKLYAVSFVVIIIGIPASVMLFCYANICFIILQIQRSYRSSLAESDAATAATSLNFQTSSDRITRAKLRMVKMTFAVVVCFIICWAPYCVAILVFTFTHSGEGHGRVGPIHMIVLLVASLNSAVNPWIYAAFTSNGIVPNSAGNKKRHDFHSSESSSKSNKDKDKDASSSSSSRKY